MTKHTPGPWACKHHGEWITARDETLGEIVIAKTNGAEWLDNARLIACAPDLLASLRRVLRILEVNDARLANFGEAEEARAIISRAEGAPYWGER